MVKAGMETEVVATRLAVVATEVEVVATGTEGGHGARVWT